MAIGPNTSTTGIRPMPLELEHDKSECGQAQGQRITPIHVQDLETHGQGHARSGGDHPGQHPVHRWDVWNWK